MSDRAADVMLELSKQYYRASQCGLIFAILAVHIASTAAAANTPNVLMIVVDDLGYADLGVLGSKDMQTPNLDQLYADSVRLNQYYANSPVCSPTRAAILTGCYPDRVGVPGVIRTADDNSWGFFGPTEKTLPGIMKDAGYDTAAVGKWHLGLRPENHPINRDFDTFKGFLGDMMDDYYGHRRHGINYMQDDRDEIDPKGHATDLFSDWAVDYIRTKGSRRFAKPWFLYLAYNAPHSPIQPPKDWFEKVQRRETGIDSTRAKLVALIEHLDDGIGRVISELKQTEQYDKTAIVFTSDNGGQLSVGANNGPLRGGKGMMYEGGLRIPGCIRVPERTKAGSTSNAVCSTVDLLPTLAEIVGSAPPTGIDGESLGPLLASPDRLWPEREIYFVRREGGVQYAGMTIQAIRKGDMKLVRNLPTSKFELYDLAADPQETTDLISKFPRLFRDLVARLQYHEQRAGGVPWQKKDPEFWPVKAGR